MFYPGMSIGFKRATHTLVLCGLSLNLFLQDVETRLLQQINDSTNQMELLLPEIENTDLVLSPMINSLEAIEQSKAKWIIEYFGLPSSQRLESKKEALMVLKRNCDAYNKTSIHFAIILKWVGWAFMIPILISGLWMYLDLVRGRKKFLTLVCLLIATFINYKIYGQATIYVDQFLHI